MHEHDLDLIASFAEGSLADDHEARALVERCEECRQEYQAQLSVLEWLGATPQVEMTDLEKAALHRDLWTELGNAPAARRTGAWWYRWSYVAAGLFVIIGLVSVISGQLTLGGGDTGGVAETSTDSAADNAGGEDALVPLYGAQESDGGSERATTTIAAAEALPYPFADLADEARAKRRVGDPAELAQPLPDGAERCLLTLDLGDQVVVEVLDLDRTYLVVMPGEDPGAATVTFVALETCEIVHVDG
jgi:hypothetical protein